MSENSEPAPVVDDSGDGDAESSSNVADQASTPASAVQPTVIPKWVYIVTAIVLLPLVGWFGYKVFNNIVNEEKEAAVSKAETDASAKVAERDTKIAELEAKVTELSRDPSDRLDLSTNRMFTSFIERPDGRVKAQIYITGEKGYPSDASTLASRTWREISEDEAEEIARAHGIDLSKLRSTPPDLLDALDRLREAETVLDESAKKVEELKDTVKAATDDTAMLAAFNELTAAQTELLDASNTASRAKAKVVEIKRDLDK